MKNILLVCCTLVCSGLLQAQSSTSGNIVQASAVEILNVIPQCPADATVKGKNVNRAVTTLNKNLSNGYYVTSVTKEVIVGTKVEDLGTAHPKTITTTRTVFLIKTSKDGKYPRPKVIGPVVKIEKTVERSQPQGQSNPSFTEDTSCNEEVID